MCDILFLKLEAESCETQESSKDHKDESVAKTKLEDNMTSSEAVDEEITLDKIDGVYCELQKWADISESKVCILLISNSMFTHCVEIKIMLFMFLMPP